jgi:hypothetical protein
MSRTICDSAVHTLIALKAPLSLKDARVRTSHRSSFRSFASISRWFVCSPCCFLFFDAFLRLPLPWSSVAADTSPPPATPARLPTRHL